MPDPVRVVVVGGGISGLATTWYLGRRLPDARVTLLEADDRLGGKVRTRRLAGQPVDVGPDALLVRGGAVRDLVRDLGLTGAVRRTAGRPAYVWTRGALRPLPAMSLFGVPDNPFALVRTGVLSVPGALRAAADLVLPRRALPEDPSIADLVRPRLGREVFDRLVEPMLGGVHAGRAGLLSARSAVPEVHAAVSRGRSVYLALRERRRRRPAPAAPGPAPDDVPTGMVTFADGLTTLTDALAAAVPGATVRTRSAVARLDRDAGADGDGWDVVLCDGSRFAADVVVLAVPAPVAARLLAPHAPDAAQALHAVPYAGVATVTLAYDREHLVKPLRASGFLVPPGDGRLLVGSTWTSAKWEHLDPDGAQVVLRCAVGRHGDDRCAHLDDDALVAAVHAELAEAGVVHGGPAGHLVTRWPAAMPQYTVGHADRVAAVDAALTALPGLHLVGAAYRGVGLATCIAQADALVTRIAADAPAGSAAPQEVGP